MPYPLSSKGYGGSSSSTGVGYSSIPTTSYMPGLSSMLLGSVGVGRHDFSTSSSSRSPLYGSGANLGILGFGGYGLSSSSSYGSPYGSSTSAYGGYGGYTSTAGQKSYSSYLSALPTISEHSSSAHSSAANKRRVPRTYIPVVPLPSAAGNRKALYTSSGFKTLYTEDIDVTTPRKAAKPGEISRERSGEGFGTIRRGRTVIRLETKKLKENPYLGEQESKRKSVESKPIEKMEVEEQKEKPKEQEIKVAEKEELEQVIEKEKQVDSIIPPPAAVEDNSSVSAPSSSSLAKDYSHLTKWYEEELRKPIKKERNAGDKFREKYMVHSRKNKQAGYRRPTLSDIRAQKAVVLKEIEERIKKLETAQVGDTEMPEEMKAETDKLEKDKERLARLDKKMAKRFSRALRKAEAVAEGDTSDDDSVAVDRQSTVKTNALRKTSAGTIKSTDLPKSSSKSNLGASEAIGQRLTRKVTKRFFFPAEGFVNAEPQDQFEKNILAQRQTVKTRATQKKVAHINQRKSSASDLEVPCDLLSDKRCDVDGGDVLEATEELPEILEEITPKPPSVKELPPGKKKKYVKKVGDPPVRKVPGNILQALTPTKDSDCILDDEETREKGQPGPKVNGIISHGGKQAIIKNKLIPAKFLQETLTNKTQAAVIENVPVRKRSMNSSELFAKFQQNDLKPPVDVKKAVDSPKSGAVDSISKINPGKINSPFEASKTENNKLSISTAAPVVAPLSTLIPKNKDVPNEEKGINEVSKNTAEVAPITKQEKEIKKADTPVGTPPKSRDVTPTPNEGKLIAPSDKKITEPPVGIKSNPLIAKLKPKLALDNKSASFDKTTPRFKMENKSASLDSPDCNKTLGKNKNEPFKQKDNAEKDIPLEVDPAATTTKPEAPAEKAEQTPVQKKNIVPKALFENLGASNPKAVASPTKPEPEKVPIDQQQVQVIPNKEETKNDAKIVSTFLKKPLPQDVNKVLEKTQVKGGQPLPPPSPTKKEAPSSPFKKETTPVVTPPPKVKEEALKPVKKPEEDKDKKNQPAETKPELKSDKVIQKEAVPETPKKISPKAETDVPSKQNLVPVKVQDKSPEIMIKPVETDAAKCKDDIAPTAANNKFNANIKKFDNPQKQTDAIKQPLTANKLEETTKSNEKVEKTETAGVAILAKKKPENLKIPAAKDEEKAKSDSSAPPSPKKKVADTKLEAKAEDVIKLKPAWVKSPPKTPKLPICKGKLEYEKASSEKPEESSITTSPPPPTSALKAADDEGKVKTGKENKQAQNKGTPAPTDSLETSTSPSVLLQNGHLSPPLTPKGKAPSPQPNADKQQPPKSPQLSETTQKEGGGVGAAGKNVTTTTSSGASNTAPKVENLGCSTETTTNGPESKKVTPAVDLLDTKMNKLGNLFSASKNISSIITPKTPSSESNGNSGQILNSVTADDNNGSGADANKKVKDLIESSESKDSSGEGGDDGMIVPAPSPIVQSLKSRKSLKRGSSESSESSSISSSGSSTSTAKSESGSSTTSTLSAGSSAGSRRMPSPPIDDDSDEDRIALDKICPAKTRPKYRKYEIADFQFLKVLGKGSFGKVLLAELNGSDSYFAIKCLKKDVVLEDDDVECTMIERKVLLMSSKHPYLCHLFCTFQTESHLFFVMEYLNDVPYTAIGSIHRGASEILRGGNCIRTEIPSQTRGHIQTSIIPCLQKLTAENAEMMNELDLKLDNILLDYEGHLRIADFGMCKLQIYLDRTADTFCGTPDYMSPEIIKGLRYNQCVDWWAFCVLMYEMLIGQSPFSGHDEDELFWSVCNEPVHYPRFLSKESKRLLELLLEKDASKRLGTVGCQHEDVKDQAFFQPIDWERLEKRDLEPPFKPKLKHSLDVQYFDTTFTKEAARLKDSHIPILILLTKGTPPCAPFPSS